jgi:hypothetical protein
MYLFSDSRGGLSSVNPRASHRERRGHQPVRRHLRLHALQAVLRLGCLCVDRCVRVFRVDGLNSGWVCEQNTPSVQLPTWE